MNTDLGIRRLKSMLHSNSPLLLEIDVLSSRLMHTEREANLYGWNQNLNYERAKIWNELNKRARQSTNCSFDELCNPDFDPESFQELAVEYERTYVLLLIDSSESMLWPYRKSGTQDRNSKEWSDARDEVRKAISSAHEMALSALRGSRICKDRQLYIYQYLFNNRKILLNLPELLSPLSLAGQDKVIRLAPERYTPEGRTALLDTILEGLTAMKEYLDKARVEEHRIDRVIIAVITDGDDNMAGEARPDKLKQIRQLLADMQRAGERNENHLLNTLLIGLTSSDFEKRQLKALKTELGFIEAIGLEQINPQGIRSAFKLWSTLARG